MTKAIPAAALCAALALGGCNCSGKKPAGSSDAGSGDGGGSDGGSGAAFGTSLGAPPAGTDPTLYGQYVVLAVDPSGKPMVAFIAYDSTGSYGQSTVYFSRYDGAHWSALSAAGTLHGDTRTQVRGRPLALACDADTGVIGLAYTSLDGQGFAHVAYASSANGTTWTTVSQLSYDSSVTNQAEGSVSVALTGGSAWVAWGTSGGTLVVANGAETASAAAAFTQTQVTVPATQNLSFSDGADTSLAVDSAKQVGLIFYVGVPAGDRGLDFWRPSWGASTPAVLVAPSGYLDSWDAELAFHGTSPRVLANLFDGTDADHLMATVASTDDGHTWAAPVKLPNDQGTIVGGHQSLAIDAQGHGVTAATGLGGDGSHTCGDPKVYGSTDFATWAVCLPGVPTTTVDTIYFPAIAFTPAGKLVVAFEDTGAGGVTPDLGPGVWVWQQP